MTDVIDCPDCAAVSGPEPRNPADVLHDELIDTEFGTKVPSGPEPRKPRGYEHPCANCGEPWNRHWAKPPGFGHAAGETNAALKCPGGRGSYVRAECSGDDGNGPERNERNAEGPKGTGSGDDGEAREADFRVVGRALIGEAEAVDGQRALDRIRAALPAGDREQAIRAARELLLDFERWSHQDRHGERLGPFSEKVVDRFIESRFGAALDGGEDA